MSWGTASRNRTPASERPDDTHTHSVRRTIDQVFALPGRIAAVVSNLIGKPPSTQVRNSGTLRRVRRSLRARCSRSWLP